MSTAPRTRVLLHFRLSATACYSLGESFGSNMPLLIAILLLPLAAAPGYAQSTAPPVAAPQRCAGDWEGDGVVGIDNLIRGIGISNGMAALDDSPSFDGDGDGRVSIAELVVAVNHSLEGCPCHGSLGELVCGGDCPDGMECAAIASIAACGCIEADPFRCLSGFVQRFVAEIPVGCVPISCDVCGEPCGVGRLCSRVVFVASDGGVELDECVCASEVLPCGFGGVVCPRWNYCALGPEQAECRSVFD